MSENCWIGKENNTKNHLNFHKLLPNSIDKLMDLSTIQIQITLSIAWSHVGKNQLESFERLAEKADWNYACLICVFFQNLLMCWFGYKSMIEKEIVQNTRFIHIDFDQFSCIGKS